MQLTKERYQKQAVPGMKKAFGYENVMMVPRLVKVVLNIGLGEAIANAKALEAAQADLVAISGQHPVTTRSRRSIANFKLRKGMPIGLKVTLRGQRMYDFVDKLIAVTLPRVREFHGVPTVSFDGRGNYTLGFTEQTVFPEIDFSKIDKARGLEVVIVTTARTPEEGRKLLELIGMPFSKE